MYLSITCLCKAVENHQKIKENYENANKQVNPVAVYLLLAMALIFLLFEIILFVYAIIIAVKCSKSSAERIVHIVLAITFTLPYMLVMAVFNDCGKKVLRGGSSSYRFGDGECQTCSL